MSLDLADRQILQPVAFVPVLKHNILRRFTAASENNPFFVYYDDWVSDHLPISINLVQNKKPFFNTAQIPRWLAEDIVFLENIEANLPVYDGVNKDPFVAFDDFCMLRDSVAVDIRKSRQDAQIKTGSEIASLHVLRERT